jgi:hypothetical protein
MSNPPPTVGDQPEISSRMHPPCSEVFLQATIAARTPPGPRITNDEPLFMFSASLPRTRRYRSVAVMEVEEEPTRVCGASYRGEVGKDLTSSPPPAAPAHPPCATWLLRFYGWLPGSTWHREQHWFTHDCEWMASGSVVPATPRSAHSGGEPSWAELFKVKVGRQGRIRSSDLFLISFPFLFIFLFPNSSFQFQFKSKSLWQICLHIKIFILNIVWNNLIYL